MEFYPIKIGKLTRQLPIVSLGPKLKIASLNLLGDGELVSVCASLLFLKIKGIKFDYFVGPEVKIVPLVHELSQKFKKDRYIICRKKIHGYMVDPITTEGKFSFTINGVDADLLKNKRVLIIDDVISTGKTVAVVNELMEICGAKMVGLVAIAKQGKSQYEMTKDLIHLTELPIFRENSSRKES